MDLFTKFFTICELYEFCEKIFFSHLYNMYMDPMYAYIYFILIYFIFQRQIHFIL